MAMNEQKGDEKLYEAQIQSETPCDEKKMKEEGGIDEVNLDQGKEEEKKNTGNDDKAKRSSSSSSSSDGDHDKENGDRESHDEDGKRPLSLSNGKNTEEIENKGQCSSALSSSSSDAKCEESSSSNLVKEEGSDIGFLTDLKENETKALMDLRSLVDEAILANKFLFKEEKKEQESSSEEKKEIQENHEDKHNEDGGRNVVDKGKAKVEQEEKSEKISEDFQNITLWGVPLLPSKGDKRTDVLLLKFLRAREFKANDAFEMLKDTLRWRKENKIDSIMDEDFGNEYDDSVAYVRGSDREGHPVCYNVYGVFANNDMYNKTFGTEASRERFLRWRLHLMEKQIQELDFELGGISSLLQVNDLRNTPGPSRRDLRLATKRAVGILQDNYPEFVARNIFINVPFWYYAFNAILSPFLTQRTKSKFVFSRPSRVTETLLKYIAAEKIPVKYGGLWIENDTDFSIQDSVSETFVKAGATETIEIPVPEVGKTLVWDLTVIGWDVNYKEEFVPTDESSYTLIVKKAKKIIWQDEPIRNSFKNKEPGKLVITIENGIFKKKHVLYRYKTKLNP